MSVAAIIFGLSIILFFGIISDIIFKKAGVPDVISLILIGMFLRKFHYVDVGFIKQFAPLFTTITLILILFDGSLSIKIKEFFNDIPNGTLIAAVNFLVSTIISFIILRFSGYEILVSLFVGFAIGGVSSSFAIPILKRIKGRRDSFLLLTIESSVTDVLCIVFAISTLEFYNNTFNVFSAIYKLFGLFGIASLVGVSFGLIWSLIINYFKKGVFDIETLAMLLLTYSATEFLHGNGALAALFFGITISNLTKSREISNFYDEITFLMKTFFFVYIGIMFNTGDFKSIMIGTIISISLMISRYVSIKIFKLDKKNEIVMSSIFGRGIAAAALAQIATEFGFPPSIINIIYTVIFETMLLSSVRILLLKRNSVKVEYPFVAR